MGSTQHREASDHVDSGAIPSMEELLNASFSIPDLDFSTVDLNALSSLIDATGGALMNSLSTDLENASSAETPATAIDPLPSTEQSDDTNKSHIAATNRSSASVPSSDHVPSPQFDSGLQDKEIGPSHPVARQHIAKKPLSNSDIIKSALAELSRNDQQVQPGSTLANSSRRASNNTPSIQGKRKHSAIQEAATDDHNKDFTDSSQRPFKQPKTSIQKPVAGLVRGATQHRNMHQAGASKVNPMVLDDDGDYDGDCTATSPPRHAHQHKRIKTTSATTTMTTTTTTTTQPPPANIPTSNNPRAVAFAVKETFPLNIGGDVHRIFAFSPSCNVAVRRDGKLISVVKGAHTLHFTHRTDEDNNNNNNGGGNDGGKGHGGAAAHALVTISPFQLVGFGPCRRCAAEQVKGTTAITTTGPPLCDCSFPCGPCKAAGMDCQLPVVERPVGAVNGDELLEMGMKGIVMPGMAVIGGIMARDPSCPVD